MDQSLSPALERQEPITFNRKHARHMLAPAATKRPLLCVYEVEGWYTTNTFKHWTHSNWCSSVKCKWNGIFKAGASCTDCRRRVKGEKSSFYFFLPNYIFFCHIPLKIHTILKKNFLLPIKLTFGVSWLRTARLLQFVCSDRQLRWNTVWLQLRCEFGVTKRSLVSLSSLNYIKRTTLTLSTHRLDYCSGIKPLLYRFLILYCGAFVEAKWQWQGF